MRIKDRRRIGPLLLMVSLAVVGSMIMLMMATTTSNETVAAQAGCVPADSPFAGLPGFTVCGEEETPTPTNDDCVPSDSPFAGLPGFSVCPDLNATATAEAADMTATAEANAAATAAAVNATQTAVATAATAVAVQTAAAQAQETAVAVQTAEALASATAAAQMRRTAAAQANMTRTAVAEATAAAGGAPPPAPRATATPVMVEKADVTAVEGATTVEPDAQVVLMAGNVTVKFPTLSRSRTFQAMLSESGDCGDMAMACAMLSIYNAEGEMESDVRLISSAEIDVMLDAATVDELGGDLDGGAVAIQANALGGIMLQLLDDDSGEWNTIPSEFTVNSDGSVSVNGMTRRFSHIALNVYPDVVEQARMQVSAALGTPTATPIPPTATPAPPTATPVPPTPIPPTPVPPPPTGDEAVPFLMLLAMAVAASMLALVGTKFIVARVRR